MRQIVLDTETTGLEPSQGHRIIEIGCVELDNRKLTGNHYHQYLQPDRDIDEGAQEIHGITPEFLADKPRFADIVDEFLGFVKGAELIIHNAAFDVGFINAELQRLDARYAQLGNYCTVLDSLAIARKKHPGQKNNLDALCKRYGVDNTQRDLHGALLDAEILADVYLYMTGGQVALSLEGKQENTTNNEEDLKALDANRPVLKVIRASEEELQLHQNRLLAIDKASAGHCRWLHAGQDVEA
jgi:DNA polymerase-3 subunit epsilon